MAAPAGSDRQSETRRRARIVQVMPQSDMERRSIDTIRVLAMDARPEGERGPSGHGDGARAGRVPASTRSSCGTTRPTRLARPRPLRPLGGPCLHPPVRGPAPDRLRPVARRPEAVPSVGLENAGPSRALPHARASRRPPARSARASRTASASAIAERFLAQRYNRPHHEIVDHRVYAICSDGDLMEGVASEAASIAGHLGLGKLIYFYDDNRITIDGTTALSFSGEDKGARFEAYGWHVQHVHDVNDLADASRRLRAAHDEVDRPSPDRRPLAHRLSGAARDRHGQGARHRRSARTRCARTKEVLGWDPDEHVRASRTASTST